MTFIQHAGVSLRIRLSQFRLKKLLMAIFSLHTVQIWSRLVQYPQRLWGQKLHLFDKMAKMKKKSAFRTKYLSMYGFDRNHIFCADRQMSPDQKLNNKL